MSMSNLHHQTDDCVDSRGLVQGTGRLRLAREPSQRGDNARGGYNKAPAHVDGIGCPATGGTSLASPWPPFTCSFQLGASRNSWSKNVGEPAPGDKSAALGRAAANRAMDPPTPQRAAAAPRWLPPRHALPPGAAPLMMLPFGPPPGPGWLPMLPVVGTAPAPARGIVPAPAPARWVPLPRPRRASAVGALRAARRGARGRLAAAAPRRGRAGCPSCGRRAARCRASRGRRL